LPIRPGPNAAPALAGPGRPTPGIQSRPSTEVPDWLNLAVHHPSAAADAVSALLFEAGAGGIWEDRPDEAGRTVTRAGFSPADQARLRLLLPALADRVAAAFGLSGAEFEWSLELEENHDWAEKWKEGLRPVAVNSRLAVAPTWWPGDNLPPAGIVLRLDPGLAFGSGHHASTCLCLDFLTELAPAARRVLDLGSGSGILALAAAALNPGAEVFGVDNDSTTLTVARDNAAVNGLADRVDFRDTLAGLPAPFDLIAANITLGALQELAPEVTGLAAVPGRLILSGLLTVQAAEAVQAYQALGWTPTETREREEWSGLTLVRRG
jgi:ribosomal protein L11 methyltransferase